jgi:Ser/Thr protein kinase RdoA (MazF antagonist)
MWRLQTERGRYAVKQLSPSIRLADPGAAHRFNASEAVAEAFASRGVPAVFALRGNGDYLQLIDGAGYLVYPWRDAEALAADRVSRRHALVIARILGKMHNADLSFPDLGRHEYDVDSGDNIAMLVQLAQAFRPELAGRLQRGLPAFLDIVDAQAAAIRLLEGSLVVCHGDLDPKNVLWDAGSNPEIIDWESARLLNPTYEVLLEALNWSGIWTRLDRDLFGQFFDAYRAAGGTIEEEALSAAYRCVLGDWVYWLMYNVGRCLDMNDPRRRRLGEKQIALALAVLQRLMDHVPDLLCIPGGRLADV